MKKLIAFAVLAALVGCADKSREVAEAEPLQQAPRGSHATKISPTHLMWFCPDGQEAASIITTDEYSQACEWTNTKTCRYYEKRQQAIDYVVENIDCKKGSE